MNLQVYLNFSGETEMVAQFYAEALGLQKPTILRFGDLPSNPEYPLPEEYKNYVMHTELDLGSSKIQLSDIVPNMTPKPLSVGNNISVVLTFDSLESITTAYNNLSVDAKSIAMPLGKTMWAEGYAYFVDKFGTPWQLNFAGEQVFRK